MKKSDYIITICYNGHSEVFGKHKGEIVKKEDFKQFRCDHFEEVEEKLREIFNIFANKKLITTNGTSETFGEYGILSSVEYDLHVGSRKHNINSSKIELFIKDKRMEYKTKETVKYSFPIITRTVSEEIKKSEEYFLSNSLKELHLEIDQNKRELRKELIADFLEIKKILKK